ncbi:hypothetical protein [uncultured Citricoccus sp.]|uniref:hypothetical protein n=1 Tax=uncultured Citricoccus sp. TaxID=614031 RepID=UPI002619A067|nr:hypothetical protein [uncultured Citricoccus sp.]
MTETETTQTEADHVPDAGNEIDPQGAQDGAQETPETFPREYVEKLRQAAAGARVKAKKADDYARELFHARVAALGKLADPSDLTFDDKLLDDHPALEAAVDELISRKPHLASRQPRGDVGQGDRGGASDIDLAGMLRRNA